MKKVEKSAPSTSSFVKVSWIDGFRFVATDSLGHSIVMDASKQSGGEGSGVSPLQLLLIALGGCTGMDVVHIMRKQRQQVNSLEVLVSGERVKEPPQVYNNIRVEYKIKGKIICLYNWMAPPDWIIYRKTYNNSGANKTMLPMTCPLSSSSLALAASKIGNFSAMMGFILPSRARLTQIQPTVYKA